MLWWYECVDMACTLPVHVYCHKTVLPCLARDPRPLADAMWAGPAVQSLLIVPAGGQLGGGDEFGGVVRHVEVGLAA